MSFVSESSRLVLLVNFKSKLRAEGHEVTKALFFQIFFKVSALLQARSWAKAFQAICTLDGNINFFDRGPSIGSSQKIGTSDSSN